MCLNRVYFSIYLLCVILSMNLVISEEFVPVYLWETAKSDVIVPALPRVNTETFQEIIEQRLTKNPTVLVFVEPSLSPEDFREVDNSGKKTFPFLSDVKSYAQTAYLPSVEDPIEVIESLNDGDITQVTLKEFLKNPNTPSSHVLLIDLNDVEDDEDRINMLRRHDSSISKVYKLLSKENSNILAILTARRTSWIIPEDSSKGRKIRNILETNSTEGDQRLYQTDNFLLYVSDTAVLRNAGITSNLNEHVASQSNITNATLRVELTRTNFSTVGFEFTLINGFWSLEEVEIVDPANASNVVNLVPRSIGAPSRFSYQCTSQVFFERNNRIRNLSLPGMQIQPFVNFASNVSFGDAYFCVGFTTAPIWSGLFVTAILVIIMSIGLCMMLDIRTMDRFDDPKGKTIVINVSE